MRGTITRPKDHLVGLLLAVAYVAVLLGTAGDLGMSRDESMYVHAAESYGRWYELLWNDPDRALQQNVIDAHFKINHEHPGLAKTLFAWSWLLHKHTHLFANASTAHRFPGMLSAGLLLWLIYIMGTRYAGRIAGLGAALLYGLLPRVFYHSHLNCFDVPIVLAVAATSYAYLRSLHALRWAAICGLTFGLALATKHNSWILPGIYLVHFSYVKIARHRAGGPAITTLPTFLPAMLLLGPPLLVATWPWLWNDGVTRFLWYARFHMQHEYYNMAYFGLNYFQPPFPLSFPFVMTAFTVPVTTLMLTFIGLYAEGRAELARLRGRMAPGDDGTHAVVLYLGCLLAPLLLIALPSTPIFGGTKHWMTAYPFMCLFAGAGVSLCAQSAKARFGGRLGSAPVAAGALLAAAAPGAVETAHSHPFGLSHYGVLAGGVPGAAKLGMNRQFWGFTTGSLSDFFVEHMPRGGRVYICDTTHLAFHLMGKDGLLPRGVVSARGLMDADFALVHHEHHFADVDFQIWTVYGTVKPFYVLTYDGVPIISVYKNPHR